MFRKFYPGEYAASAYEVNYESLWEQGIRGIIFDIDNTLVHHGAPADARAVSLVRRLKQTGFSVCLISNNSRERVQPFAEAVGAEFLEDAGKPSKRGYLHAVKLLGCPISQVIFIGDQVFTDIYGANRAGLRSVLVGPLDPREGIQIVLKRRLERIVLYFYKKKLK